jgi:hypothetical protein
MEADDLLCSRNARPQNDSREQADRSSCSQNAHDKNVLVRCAQEMAVGIGLEPPGCPLAKYFPLVVEERRKNGKDWNHRCIPVGTQ